MRSPDTPLTQEARKAFKEGDYNHALKCYTDLAARHGMRLYKVNIELCLRKLNRASNIETIDIPEVLIESAQRLAQMKESSIELIQSRMAIVGGNPWSAKQLSYAKRVQLMANHFQANGFEVKCFVSGIWDAKRNYTSEPDVYINNVHYLVDQGTPSKDLQSPEDNLMRSLARFRDWFEAYRPQIIVAAGDFNSSLPAIVAARQLSIPVITEHLNYADIFHGLGPEEDLNYLDFGQRYALDQACLSLAEASYYIYPNEESSWRTLDELIRKTWLDKPQGKPLSILNSHDSYTAKAPVFGEGLYFLELEGEDANFGNEKGIVASFSFYRSNGHSTPVNISCFSSSKAFPHYRYIDTKSSNNARNRILVFQLPKGISQINIDIVAHRIQDKFILHNIKAGRVTLSDVARWLTLKPPGIDWINAVEDFVRIEGAASLSLALLDYKYRISKQSKDQKRLRAAIDEFIELDTHWLPELPFTSHLLPAKTNTDLTVLHLHKTSYPFENTGGAIRCLNTVVSQKRIGIDPYIITPIGYPRSSGHDEARNHELIQGIEHFRIGATTDGLRAISNLDKNRISVFHIAKRIKDRGACIIHAASGVRGYELVLQALALKRLTGLPVIYEVRSFHEHTWSPLRSDIMELERTQLRLIKENYCMAKADLIVTISDSMKRILVSRGLIAKKIEVIPNAIDENKYLGKTFSAISIPVLEGAEMVVGYISNMSLREGHHYLIHAIHQIRKRSGRDIRGLLVGNGPELVNLKSQTSELDMNEAIFFSGEIDHSQINAYYMAIDIFVIPRILDYAANWVTPLKPYEAMALGRPIVATDLPALREIIGDHEERGIIAKPADVESLVVQIQRYLEDPELRRNKAQSAMKWVFAERTWTANAKRYEEIYKQLVDGSIHRKDEVCNA